MRFFKDLTEQNKKLIKDYLSSKPEENNQSLEASSFILKQSPLIKDLLALAREEIQNLLPLTCMKLSNQNYGLSATTPYAIPYHGSDNPSLNSQFGTAYETLNYSIQLLIKREFDKKFIVKEIEFLRNTALQELKEDPTKTLEDTTSHQNFIKLTGNDSSLSLFGSDAIIEKIQLNINQNLSLKLDFFKKYIAPEIRSHAKTLSINSQMFNFLFSNLNAFTGTQWNADTFPERLNIVSDEMITGKTLSLLWNYREDPIQIVNTVSQDKTLSELIDANPQALKANALIDTAGMIRGIDRKEVASRLLKTFEKLRPEIKGIVFYDAANELMILEKGKKDPIALTNSKLSPAEYFTFYDQQHTTGADIKQISEAMGIVTIGRHTILRDLLQSVWRLRGLEKSQHVQFTIDQEVKEIIISAMKELGVMVTEPLQLEHLLLFTSYNQALLQGDNNYRSFKHKTSEILQQEAFKAFLNPSLKGEELAKIIRIGGTFIYSKYSFKSLGTIWATFFFNR